MRFGQSAAAVCHGHCFASVSLPLRTGTVGLRAWRHGQPFSSSTRAHSIPAARPGCVCSLRLRILTMREHTHPGRAARRWYLLVGVRWQRFQSSLAALYHRRVTYPVQVWRAFGAVWLLRPVIPWWQPLLYSWLHATGYAPRRTRSDWQRFRQEHALRRWGV